VDRMKSVESMKFKHLSGKIGSGSSDWSLRVESCKWLAPERDPPNQ